MDGYYKVYFETKEFNSDYYIGFVKKISEDSEKALWYFHPNGKDGKGPHIHGYVYNYKYTDDTLRSRIKASFNLATQRGGKGEFAISNTFKKGEKMSSSTINGYISYMSKGQYDPIFDKSGISRDNINIMKESWIANGPANANVNNVNITYIDKPVRKKITQFQISQLAKSEYENMYIDNGHFGVIPFNPSQLMKIVIKLLKQNNMLAHKRMVANILQDIQSDLDPEEFSRSILSML